MPVTIALEGLPVAVAITTVAGLAWAWEPVRRAFLIGLATTFLVAALLSHVAARGPGMVAPVCDAVSSAVLAVLGVAAVGSSAATLLRGRTRQIRFGPLAVSGFACTATLVLRVPECLRVPFVALDPLVYRVWYENVPEGLPLPMIWRR